jgi:hypothetical protein
MFKDLGFKLLKVIRAKPPGTPWSIWLEGRYGWRTLIYDIEGIAEALVRLKDAEQSREKSHSSQTARFVKEDDWTQDCGYITYSVTQREIAKISGLGRFIADVEVPDFAFNPLTTAWELIRFSFVIDWFISIGKTLSALCAVWLSQDYDASSGIRVELDITWWSHSYSVCPAYVGQLEINKLYLAGEYNCVLLKRMPTSVSSIPQIKLNLNASKITDLLALIVQALTRR